MSGKDHDQVDDAELAAFLQGDDPLARDLAALEQPAPPAVLDAAIQARIAAALAAEKLAALPAANDPVAIPTAAPGPSPTAAAAPAQPRWQSRWQLPMALAAGVAAISVALPLWQTHDPVTEATVIAAPAVHPEPSAPPPPPAPRAIETPAAPAPESVAALAPAQTPAPAPALAPQAKQASAKPAAGRAAALPATPAAEPPANPAISSIEKKSGLQDAVVAEDVASAPPPQSDLRRYARTAPASPSAAQAPQIPLPARSGSVATTVIANATNVRPSPQYALPPAPPAPPAPPPPPAPAPAPMAFAPMAPVVQPAPAAQAAPAQSVSISGSRILAQHELQPREWLQKIEDLLRANERDEALAEWQKFRAAYPAYPVPDKVSESFPPVVK